MNTSGYAHAILPVSRAQREECPVCKQDYDFPRDILYGRRWQRCKCGTAPLTPTPETVHIPPEMIETGYGSRAFAEATCVVCGATFRTQALSHGKLCSQTCRRIHARNYDRARNGTRTRTRTRTDRRRGGKAGMPRNLDPTCPTCGAQRVRGSPYPKRPAGIWRCHACERRRYHERQAEKRARRAAR